MGESGVGKSSLISRLCDGVFKETIQSTRGVADRKKEMQILERKITLHIWDTAGQEHFRGINRMYYRNASGAILVFDLTNLESFKKLDSWLQEFNEEVSDGEMILVGCKLDLSERRKVPADMARLYALKHNMAYLETSAKDGSGVSEAFSKLGENILNKVICSNGPATNGCNSGGGVKLGKPEKRKSGCCN